MRALTWWHRPLKAGPLLTPATVGRFLLLYYNLATQMLLGGTVTPTGTSTPVAVKLTASFCWLLGMTALARVKGWFRRPLVALTRFTRTSWWTMASSTGAAWFGCLSRARVMMGTLHRSTKNPTALAPLVVPVLQAKPELMMTVDGRTQANRPR